MARLMAVATVLASNAERESAVVELAIVLPAGPVTLTSLSLMLGNQATPSQLVQIHAGTSALRRAFSGQVLTHFVFRRVKQDMLSRTDVGSDEAWARIQDGGALISLGTDPGFRGLSQVGRPLGTSIDDAFKNAIGEAVGRIMRLGAVADRDDYAIYEREYGAMGQRLQSCASLFNINTAHDSHHALPVLNWCEINGPGLLAAAYGMAPDGIDKALEAAFKSRLKTRPFETVLADELARIETLFGWIAAHFERKKGTASRRDTTRRALNENELDWDTAPGSMEPPSMSAKVRRNIVAQDAMTALTTQAMLEAAFFFDLEPAYSVFLTRLYLLPILASAGLAGRLALRRQPGEIAGPVMAGALVALAETMEAKSLEGPPEPPEEDEIALFHALIRDVLARSGLLAGALAVKSYGHLQTGQPVKIEPPAGPRRFFLDD